MTVFDVITMQMFYILWPDVTSAIVANLAVTNSRRSAVFFALGDSCGGAVLKFLALFGVGALLQANKIFLEGLKIIGVCYILWIVFQIAVATVKNEDIKFTGILKKGGYFNQGFVFGVSYIPSILFYMTIFASMNDDISFFVKFLVVVWMVFFNIFYHYFLAVVLTNNFVKKDYYKIIRAVSCCFMVYFAFKTLISIF